MICTQHQIIWVIKSRKIRLGGGAGFWWENLRTLGRSKRRWEDNIKRDLKETGWGHGLD